MLDAFAELTGRVVSWLTLAMVLVTLLVVVLRYLFGIGSIALQESVTYMHAAVFMLAAAYTLKHDAHVRVDIFYQQYSPRTRAWIDLLGTLLFLGPVSIFVFTVSLDYVMTSWSIHEGSREAGGLDGVYLLKTVIPLMAALLLLAGCSVVLRSLLIIAGRPLPGEADSGPDREL
ncbi:MAG: TRAP transporter small permease subunit [Thiohalobacterales bacterium]|nr:TRAP transporter small permease subunit [Thiohalobacterales bacterium]